MSKPHLLVRAMVFLDDVVTELGAADTDGADAAPSIDAERRVRDLLEMPAVQLARCPPAVRRVVLALRDPRAARFCIVHELRDLPVESVHSTADEYFSVGHVSPGLDCGAVYTISLAGLLPLDSARAIPTASPASAPRRPYPHDAADATAVDLLASALAEDVAVTLGGARRLSMAPVLAPLCAMVATIVGVATATATKKHLDAAVIGSAITTLVPPEHRTMAERILFADHEQHVAIDVTEAPDRFVHDRNRGLALFCRDDEGNVVWNDPTVVRHPRVLRALHREPL